IGGLLGLSACVVLKAFPIPLPTTYYLDYLPVEIQPFWIFFVMVVGALLALVSSLYPVRMASRMEILPMLREE
ncbi:MAG: hypothetical protein U1D33_01965, partial [bacterium]|nr:hypothetical protein [bacterium]